MPAGPTSLYSQDVYFALMVSVLTDDLAAGVIVLLVSLCTVSAKPPRSIVLCIYYSRKYSMCR